MIDPALYNRARGCAVGAAVGDALGMPLEFGPRRPLEFLVRDMLPGRLPAGSFTDDTEMGLALAESLLAHHPLDPGDLAGRFVAWYLAGPTDVGIHTSRVLKRIAGGTPWPEASQSVQALKPAAAGNGSVMRCWPAALAHWNDLDLLLADSRQQSQVTHPHAECVEGSAFVNAVIFYLLNGENPTAAVEQALQTVDLPEPLRAVIEAAPGREREELENSGWVRHTLESAVWALLNSDSFGEVVVQTANLGRDADTAAAVAGALAGATYGLRAIPPDWLKVLQGEWPLGSGRTWRAASLAALADRLIERSPHER
ncbi:MAG: ADP-ribosylglycohydrolase family protein [Chloroflexia bacterium]|nr:ADP-ribosylglycohydrolase family protein [Chloroflexia bacterium]